MKFSRFILALATTLSLAGAVFAGTGADEGVHPALILPTQFGGWQISGSPHTSADPAMADPVNAAVLKEYGFSGFESATYTRDDGRKLTLKAARFADAIAGATRCWGLVCISTAWAIGKSRPQSGHSKISCPSKTPTGWTRSALQNGHWRGEAPRFGSIGSSTKPFLASGRR